MRKMIGTLILLTLNISFIYSENFEDISFKRVAKAIPKPVECKCIPNDLCNNGNKKDEKQSIAKSPENNQKR